MECKILDCTSRDGGYYAYWVFYDIVVDSYINSISKLTIDFEFDFAEQIAKSKNVKNNII